MRAALLLSALLIAACADAPDVPDVVEESATDAIVGAIAPSAPDHAVAEITEVDGSGISGTVSFTSLGDGAVEIRYNLDGLRAGDHGFHIHQRGDCGADSTGTPASAAGGHFNPLSSPHGAPDSSKTSRHAGDLGNITSESGQAIGTRVDSLLSFKGPTSILGKAVIVHRGADDLVSQPSGDAGARVGCGVIGRVEAVRKGAMPGREIPEGDGA